MKVLTSLLLLAIVGGLLGVHYWRSELNQRPKFRTLSATRGTLLIAFSTTGTVEPREIIDVGAQIVGCIKSFGPDLDRPGKTVDFRSRVSPGAVLAQLDDLPHRAELDKARVTSLVAEADLKRSRARAKERQQNVDRARRLRETNPEAEYEMAEAEYEIVQAEAEASEARVEQAKIVARQAEINLGYTTIRSPVEGVIIDRRVNVGQTVVAGLNAPSLFLLAKDLSRMLVWSAVNEADIGDVHIGQKVTFKVDAHRDRTFAGEVSQIRLNAALMQNVVTYGVVVEVDNTDGVLLPYMTAKLQFEVTRREQALLVPNQALRWRPTWEQITPAAREGLSPPEPGEAQAEDDEDLPKEDDEPTVDVSGSSVWVLAEDGLVRPVPVQVSLTDGIQTEVTGGALQPGDEVVVNVQRKAKPDFVSSFISKIAKRKK